MARAHTCPPYCHRCPLMKGDDEKSGIMPMCMGTAALSQYGNDLSYCTCDRSPDKTIQQILLDRVAALEARLQSLANQHHEHMGRHHCSNTIEILRKDVEDQKGIPCRVCGRPIRAFAQALPGQPLCPGRCGHSRSKSLEQAMELAE